MLNNSINVVLNSENVISGDAQSATYGISWSSILNRTKRYQMHFTYLGGANVYTGTKLPIVYFGIPTDTVIAGNNTNANYTQILGFLKPIVLVGASNTVYFQAEDNTNLPVVLTCPQSNNFTVEIRDNMGALYLDNAGVPAKPADYVMILRFIEIEEDEED
jgi:hypothetical protein